MAFIKDNPAPATIILISGDRDFAYLLSTIRWRKYNVVLISNSFMTHESLTAQASVVYDWQSDVLKARPPSRPPFLGSCRETSSSVAFLTTPQESDNSYGSYIHAVGLPNEHTTPAIQPLVLSPRPVSITTISTIRPTRATPPLDAPFVESEATPMPPKAEILADAASASIPMTPTSDDWIVADLASESAMVRPLTVRGGVIDLKFYQDQSSPKTIEPVDEDCVHSPGFVSTWPERTPPQLLTPDFLELSGNDSIRG